MATIDERVVRLELDNKSFDDNAKSSVQSLDDLKAALEFKDVDRGFRDLERAANRVDMNPLAEGVQKVSNQFNLLTTVADQTFRNLTNKVISTGEQLVSSLTIDQISSGWDKYADKTSAVQTIMAATASQFKDTGKQMEYVEQQLEQLNWFTDETSYRFLDMVQNIGKFTSNNIALEESVKAMEGISTWAAISGANVNEAGRAMYNLSQAIAVGSVKLIDWKSIENANMATAQFKQTVIETAESMGTLKKVGKDVWSTLDGKGTVSVRNFNEELKREWFTSEVLLASLEKYGGFANRLFEMTQATEASTTSLLNIIDDYVDGTLDLENAMRVTGMTAQELDGWLKELGDDQYALGRAALKAAQESKTFSEVIDYVKEAVSSGWMRSFEYIFGNYEEAKELWSELAESLYEVFVAAGDARNGLLMLWKEAGGRDIFIQGIKTLGSNVMDIFYTIQEAYQDIFPPTTVDQLLDITEGFLEFAKSLKLTEESAENLGDILRGIFNILNTVGRIGKTILRALDPIFDALNKISGTFVEIIANVFRLTNSGLDSFLDGRGLENLYSIINGISKVVAALATGSFGALFRMLEKIIEKVGEFWSIAQAAGGGLQGIVGALLIMIGDFWDSFLAGESIVNRVIDGVMALLGGAAIGIQNVVRGLIQFFTGTDFDLNEGFQGLPDWLQGLSDKLGELNLEAKLGSVVASVQNFIASIRQFVVDLGDAESDIRQIIGSVGQELVDWYYWLKSVIQDMSAGDIADVAMLFVLMDFVKKLTGVNVAMKGLLTSISGTFKATTKILNSLTEPTTLMDKLTAMFNNTRILQVGIAILALVRALNLITEMDQDRLMQAMLSLSLIMGIFMVVVNQFGKVTSKLEQVVGKGSKSKSSGRIGASIMQMGIGLMAVAQALNVISKAFSSEGGGMNIGKLIVSVSAVIGLLAAMSGVAMLISTVDSTGMMAAAGAMTLMGVAVTSLSIPLFALSALNWKKMLVGLTAVAGLLVSVGAAAKLMSGASWKTMLSAAAAFTLLSGAIVVMSAAVAGLSMLSNVWSGMAAMIVNITLVTAALAALALAAEKFGAGNLLSASTAMLTMSVGLTALAGAVAIMAAVNWEKAGYGIATMAGALILLVGAGIAGTMLPGFAQALDAVGNSMLKFGAACLMIAGAISLVTASFAAFTAFTVLLGTIGQQLGIDFPAAVDAGFDAVEEIVKRFLEMIVNLAPQIALAVGAIIAAVQLAIFMSKHQLATTLVMLGMELLGVIASFAGPIMATLTKLVDEMTKYLPQLLSALGNFVEELFAGLGDIVYSALIGLIRMIFNSIGMSGVGDDIANKMRAWADETAGETIKAAAESTSRNSEVLEKEQFKAMKNAMVAAKKGVEEGNKDVVTTANKLGAKVGDEYVQGFAGPDGLDDPGPSEKIKEITDVAVGDGLIEGTNRVLGTAEEMGALVGDTFGSSFFDSAASWVDDLFGGLFGGTQVKQYTKLVKGKPETKKYEYTEEQLAMRARARKKQDEIMADILGAPPEEIEKEIEEEAYDWGTTLDTSLAKGISSGGSSAKAARSKADEIADAFTDRLEELDTGEKTEQLLYSLWEAQHPSASEGEKAAKQIEYTNAKIQYQLERTAIAEEKYIEVLNAMGESSKEAHQAYNEFLQEQVDLANLQGELVDLQTKQAENSREGFMRFAEMVTKTAPRLLEEGMSPDQINKAIGNLTNWSSDIQNATDQIVTEGQQAALNAAENVMTTYGTAIDAKAQNIEPMFNAYGKEYASAIGNGMTSGKEYVVESLTTLNDEVVAEASTDEMVQKYVDLGKNIADGIAEGILQNKRKVIDAMMLLIDQVLGAGNEAAEVNSPSEKTIYTGEMMSAGIAVGIAAGKSGVVKSMIDVCVAAIKAAKAQLDIHSPSRKAMLLGKYVDLGLAEGMLSYVGKITEASQKVIDDMLEEARAEFDKEKYFDMLFDLGIDYMDLPLNVVANLDFSKAESQMSDFEKAFKDAAIGQQQYISTKRQIEQLEQLQKTQQKKGDLAGLERTGKRLDELRSSMNDIHRNYLSALHAFTEMVNKKNYQGAGGQTLSEAKTEFIQNIYAPTQLSTYDIYRQTNNMLSRFTGGTRR